MLTLKEVCYLHDWQQEASVLSKAISTDFTHEHKYYRIPSTKYQPTGILYFQTFRSWTRNILGKVDQYHDYWYTCSLRTKDIRNHYMYWLCKINESLSYRGHFYSYGLTLISTRIDNHIHYKVWVEIINPFSNINGAAVEVWKWFNAYITYLLWIQ